jgi:hypothetical protein
MADKGCSKEPTVLSEFLLVFIVTPLAGGCIYYDRPVGHYSIAIGYSTSLTPQAEDVEMQDLTTTPGTPFLNR